MVRKWPVEAEGTDRAQAITELANRYGADAERVLGNARELIESDPQLADLLDRAGFGYFPAVVKHLAQRVTREAQLKGVTK